MAKVMHKNIIWLSVKFSNKISQFPNRTCYFFTRKSKVAPTISWNHRESKSKLRVARNWVNTGCVRTANILTSFYIPLRVARIYEYEPIIKSEPLHHRWPFSLRAFALLMTKQKWKERIILISHYTKPIFK